MIDVLLSELRKMRSTRTNLGLLAAMLGLILLTVLVNGLVLGEAGPPAARLPAHAALGRDLRRAVRRADRRDGGDERVSPRDDPADLRRHTPSDAA